MKRWPINPRQAITIVGIVVLVFLVMDFNSRLENLNRLNRQATAVRARATQIVLIQIALQTRIVEAESNEAVEDWARDEAGYIQPGDHPVIPLPQPGSTPIIPPETPLVPTPMRNWGVWWELFFGD